MIIRDCKVEISADEVLELLDCRAGTALYEELLEEYREIEEKMLALCDPVILIAPGQIGPQLAREELKEGTKVLTVLYTIGGGISAYSTEAFRKGEYVKGMLSDSMADSALFSLGRSLEPYIKQISAELGMGISRRLEAPQDIAMEAQQYIFEQTHAAEICGMKISSGYMLDPVKSSAVMYVLSEDKELFFHQHNCRKCQRYDCKGRRIPDIPVKVFYGKEYAAIMVPEQKSILEVLQATGQKAFAAVCGGNGRCGKCKIRLRAGFLPVTKADEACLSKEALQQGVRLACKAYPQEPLEIEVEFLEEMQVLAAYQEQAEKQEQQEKQEKQPAEQQEKQPAEQQYVVAIDIGTTTIVMQLLSYPDGTVLAADTSMNHQRSFGADVISRIQASMEGKREELTAAVRRDLEEGIERLLQRNALSPDHLKEVMIACNTTMGHLLMGYDCRTLGEYPFTPVRKEAVCGKLKTLLPGFGSDAAVYQLLPCISAFVGADIVAGICFTGMDLDEEVSLFVDLGTNGEIVLGNQEKLLVTSTAAGPAFEGGNITWGVGSVEGAICGMSFIEGKPVVKTIGDKPPVGICGTGVIEIMAELYQAGIIDDTGLFIEEYFEDGYSLAETVKGETIVVTQKDIRELQLAKAAVRAGIEILLLRYGITAGEVQKVYLAGGFGFGLDCRKAAEIGMLPEELLEKVTVVGNSSLGGAVKCLVSDAARERADKTGALAEEINLSADPAFQETYMNDMFFGKS